MTQDETRDKMKSAALARAILAGSAVLFFIAGLLFALFPEAVGATLGLGDNSVTMLVFLFFAIGFGDLIVARIIARRGVRK
ncbi:MAG: hypothetical protein ACOY99_02280 [Pseudomonadota bacterium]